VKPKTLHIQWPSICAINSHIFDFQLLLPMKWEIRSNFQENILKITYSLFIIVDSKWIPYIIRGMNKKETCSASWRTVHAVIDNYRHYVPKSIPIPIKMVIPGNLGTSYIRLANLYSDPAWYGGGCMVRHNIADIVSRSATEIPWTEISDVVPRQHIN
jgi:hypothetical protein